MNNSSFDAFLQENLSRYMEDQATALCRAVHQSGQPTHSFSRRHLRRMARLLQNPARYRRPPWQRVLRTAAMVLITLGLTGAVLLSIPQVRATVWNFIRTVYETHTEYRFTEPAPEEPIELPTYHANWLPEGYEEVLVRITDHNVLLRYQNELNERIDISYSAATEGLTFSVDNEHTTERSLSVDGITYTIYETDTAASRTTITWLSENGSIFHRISGPCDADTLIQIAQNLS